MPLYKQFFLGSIVAAYVVLGNFLENTYHTYKTAIITAYGPVVLALIFGLHPTV